MPPGFVYCLNPDVSVAECDEQGVLRLTVGSRELSFATSRPGVRVALLHLTELGCTFERLIQAVQEVDGGWDRLRVRLWIEQLARNGLVCHSVHLDGQPLATAVPTASFYRVSEIDVDAAQPFVLSRFAYGHSLAGRLVYECPLSPAQIVLSCWRGAAALALLNQPRTALQVAAEIPSLTVDATLTLVNLLAETRFVAPAGAVEPDALTQWEFHDLLFHTRSRSGRHANPVGPTCRFRSTIEPLPAVKKVDLEGSIELFKPDIGELKRTDLPFTKVVEERRSIRSHGAPPMTGRELGELLFRSARVRGVATVDRLEISNRPYPSGGALYPLELYPVVNSCQGIPPGLYHYDASAHRLCLLCEPSRLTEALSRSAQAAAGMTGQPQVLIVMGARFPRMLWKYQSLGYSLILKEVGVLMQTVHLVATAMGLSACALGNGDSDLFANTAGTEYYAETSVGEVIVGRPGDPETPYMGASFPEV